VNIVLAALFAAGAAQPGLQLLREGRVAEAVASLEAAQKRDPRDAALANDLGFAYARAGKREEAERAYRLAIALKPSRWFAYANLAELVADAPDRWDRADETLALLSKGLALATGQARVKLSLRIADFERSVGRMAQARDRLQSLPELKPSADQARRMRELLDRIAEEERARSLEDWPEPAVALEQAAALDAAERRLAAGDARDALAASEKLTASQPAWRAARWLEARALEAVGRVDEEARELRALTQLAPSHALAWRKLGEILAEQGGLLEADSADEALRHALALEPSWTELWLLRARVALRQGRAQDAQRALERFERAGGSGPEAARLVALARAQAGLAAAQSARIAGTLPPSREPSQEARVLFQQAGSPNEPPEGAREILQKALEDSPGFVEAAAALVALGGAVPARTVESLNDDGAGLLELAAQVRRSGGALAQVGPWIDRAAQLGAPEAPWARAQLRLEQGDRPGALEDLLAYAASPQPAHLEEARMLRAQLVPPPRSDVSALQARLRLAEDRPEAALAALGSRCDPSVAPARLLALGEVHEFSGELPQALECYRLAASSEAALRRLARVAARAPDARAAPELQRAAALGMPAALWALARIDLDRGRPDQALPRIERFLLLAGPGDPGVIDARDARDRILRTSTAAAEARLRKNAAAALGGLGLLVAVAAWLWTGSTVEKALRRSPRLFPPIARAVGEVRHDVIKHRASVLGMIGQREAVARALLSPEPASQAVERQYQAVRKAARAQGVLLRRLSREPVFGPLVRDLARAETLLRAPDGGEDELARIEQRVREVHSARLASLLRLGPRTRVDAGAIAGWIRDVEAEMRRGGSPWTAPSILLRGMEVEFPVERGALSLIFANLLRNAQAAAAGGSVIVRLGEERDAAGRNLTVLLVGDSAPDGVSIEAIERRESGRGLALVRDLTREWQGHLVVRAEEPPWKKAVGACFPAPPA
jgi:tetratricopeptide (TPR) repeat protein